MYGTGSVLPSTQSQLAKYTDLVYQVAKQCGNNARLMIGCVAKIFLSCDSRTIFGELI